MRVDRPLTSSSYLTKIGVAVFCARCRVRSCCRAMAKARVPPWSSSQLHRPRCRQSRPQSIPGLSQDPGALCVPAVPIASNFQIVISASQTVDLNQASIQMIDGSHLGGPMVTFPSPSFRLSSTRGRILAGTTRTFAFNPRFVCGPSRPQAVSAQIDYIGPTGVMQGITIERPLRR